MRVKQAELNHLKAIYLVIILIRIKMTRSSLELSRIKSNMKKIKTETDQNELI